MTTLTPAEALAGTSVAGEKREFGSLPSQFFSVICNVQGSGKERRPPLPPYVVVFHTLEFPSQEAEKRERIPISYRLRPSGKR